MKYTDKELLESAAKSIGLTLRYNYLGVVMLINLGTH